ncbi:MAG TPA: SPFH domain-containing protein [Myxococcaceae bacterium]
MAQIRRLGPVHHLRSDASMFVLRYRRGRLTRSGRGQAFFFLPHSASIAEVPVDDREMSLSFRSRTGDYQEVTAQGVITFRVKDPRRLADRIDFTIDLKNGSSPPAAAGEARPALLAGRRAEGPGLGGERPAATRPGRGSGDAPSRDPARLP